MATNGNEMTTTSAEIGSGHADYDAIILGAGGAGLYCAITAGERSRRVLVLDHSPKLGGKILISGGGRCNFTNVGASPANYVSRNPHFVKSALSRYRPTDFIVRVEAHGIAYHEKKLGQLFCDVSARDIVAMLESDARAANVDVRLGCAIERAYKTDGEFRIETSQGTFSAPSLVIATGGFSLPKTGATGIGYRLARQFGHSIIETEAALDGFTWKPDDLAIFGALAGVSLDVALTAGGKTFRENVLFTHGGLSGPASLQASLHWHAGENLVADLLPDVADPMELFLAKKRAGARTQIRGLLGELFPARFADLLAERYFGGTPEPLPQVSETKLRELCARLKHFEWHPAGTVGYSKAEVTRGGVNTDELSSKTMESRIIPGLYFIGEVIDVTGWLGGYNFQWAWASGNAAGVVI